MLKVQKANSDLATLAYGRFLSFFSLTRGPCNVRREKGWRKEMNHYVRKHEHVCHSRKTVRVIDCWIITIKQARYVGLFECDLVSYPFRYLGIPMHHHKLCNADWSVIEYRFKRKLSTWKAKHLSYGVRLVLLNLVLLVVSPCS